MTQQPPPSSDRNAALFHAVSQCDLDAVEAFLAQGANPNAPHQVVVSWGAEEGESTAIQRTCVLQALASHQTPHPPRPRAEWNQVLQRLLDAGADPEGTGESLALRHDEVITPLLEAVESRNDEAVRMLLAHGARPQAELANGTLLHRLSSHWVPDPQEAVSDEELIDPSFKREPLYAIAHALVNAGVDPKVPNETGVAPWQWALMHSDVVVLRLLLDLAPLKAYECMEGLSALETLIHRTSFESAVLQGKRTSLMADLLLPALTAFAHDDAVFAQELRRTVAQGQCIISERLAPNGTLMISAVASVSDIEQAWGPFLAALAATPLQLDLLDMEEALPEPASTRPRKPRL